MSEMSRTEEGRWAEDILAKISPRFALKDHFEIVDRIGWLDLELKKEIFTRLELKNSIEKWLWDLEPGHPYYTVKTRAVQVMNEVVDQLLSGPTINVLLYLAGKRLSTVLSEYGVISASLDAIFPVSKPWLSSLLASLSRAVWVSFAETGRR